MKATELLRRHRPRRRWRPRQACAQILRCLSVANLPIARHKALHDLTLEIVGDAPTRLVEPAGNLSIRAVLTRLHDRIEDAPQQAGLLRDDIAAGRRVSEIRSEMAVMACISHVSNSV